MDNNLDGQNVGLTNSQNQPTSPDLRTLVSSNFNNNQAPAEQPVNLGNVPEKKKFDIKNLLKKPIFWIVTVLVIAGIVTLVVILNSNKGSSNDDSDNQSNSSEETSSKKKKTTSKDTSVRDLVSNISTIAQKYLTKNDSDEQLEQIYDAFFPVYKISSARVPIALEKSYGLRSATDSDEALMYNVALQARKQLLSDGFEEYKVVELDDGSVQFYNPETEILCVSTETKVPYYLSCGHTSWISADTVMLINGLAEAYYSVMEEYPTDLTATEDMIKNSVFDPYQYLIAKISGVDALFYRPTPTSKWEFFTTIKDDEILKCEVYEEDFGARKAYQGMECYDKKKKENRKVTNGN
ncbi:hypothetical protein IKG12_00190 [Candidatus Saccharibacteria bacterium]|nr:hypothetical protein [Candidatus Saccharibacteria bacterium]